MISHRLPNKSLFNRSCSAHLLSVDVTGIAAAMLSKNPKLKPAQVKSAIRNSAVWLSASKNTKHKSIYMAATATNLKCARPPSTVLNPGVKANPTYSPTTYSPSSTVGSFIPTYSSSSKVPSSYGPSTYLPSTYPPSTYFPSMDSGRGGKSGKTKGSKKKAKAGKAKSKKEEKSTLMNETK